MTPPKRPPPPSPVRKTTARPAAPVAASSTPAASQAAASQAVTTDNSGLLRPLLLWGGIGVGLLATLGIAVLMVIILRTGPEPVVTPVIANAPASNAKPAEPMPPAATVETPAEEANPEPTNVTAPPVSNPPAVPQPANPQPPAPAVAINSPPPPMPMVPTPPPMATAPPPTTPAPTGNALEDVRQRNRVLPVPDSKTVTRQNLSNIQVPAPKDCDLTLLGGDELCPPGTKLVLVKQDPAPDERVWNVAVKATGALSKERVVADFRLKGDQLTFQWQPASGGVIPAVMYCLLQIDAAGEQEVCYLSNPLKADPLPLKLADRWTIEARLPGDSLGAVRLQAEPLAIDFPNVNNSGNSTLATGQSTSFVVSATATGSLEVELELEVKFEQKDGKLQLVIVPYSTPPSVAKVDRAPVRSVISPAQIKRRKGELAKAATVAESQLKTGKTQLERLEREEQTLTTAVPMNVTQRNAITQQLQLVRQQIAIVEPKVQEVEEQHENLSTAAAWYSDMLGLLEQLQNQAKIGFKLFRAVGNERVVIADPLATS